MFSFGTPTAELEARLRVVEKRLLEIATRYVSADNNNNNSSPCVELKSFDTFIPRSSVPCLKPAEAESEEKLKIHCVHASSSSTQTNNSQSTSTIPLVNLHGYMNAGAYFYRNLCGLTDYFQNVYAVDMLGWGLSTRPPFHQVKDSETIQSAEDFHVDSLEAWRSMNNIDKMVLSGHSFGGYVAIAYAERYPERVERIILLSPLGVTDERDPSFKRRRESIESSFRGKAFLGVFRFMFDNTTPGGVIRSFTEYRGSKMAKDYVERRLPEITDREESHTVAEMLYINACLPASGEYFLRSILTNSFLAKNPILLRVPSLKVKAVDFVYGTTDWMDLSGGMYTQALCHRLLEQENQSPSNSTTSIPDVSVHLVPNAGHLLILQNPKIVNACVINISGGNIRYVDEEMSTRMDLNETQDLHTEWIEEARAIRKEKAFGQCR